MICSSNPALGKLCGGAFLDRGFEDLMKQRVGEKEWSNYHPEDIEHIMHYDWEHGIKRQFDGSDKSWSIRLPNAQGSGARAGRIVLKQ